MAVIEPGGKYWHLVDCGEGTQHQILRSPLSLQKLQSIAITHVHGDHCYGLPGLLASAGLGGRKDPLKIIAPKGIEAWVMETLKHTAMFLPYEIEFFAVESLKPMAVGSLTIDATALSHRVPSFAYGFVHQDISTKLDHIKLESEGIPRGPLWGALQKGDDIEFEGQTYRNKDWVQVNSIQKKVVVCGDNDAPDSLDGFIEGCDVLVHESTFTAEFATRAKEVGHSHAGLIASYAQSQSIQNLILTHFSARYAPEGKPSPSISDMRIEAENVFQGQLFLASDHTHYRLDAVGSLHQLSPC